MHKLLNNSSLPCLLTDTANPSLLLLLVSAAALADVVLAVLALSLAVDKKCERRTAANAAVLIELLLLGKDAALVTLFIQLLLHFTGMKRKKNKHINKISMGNLYPFHIFMLYFSNNFCRCEMNMRNAYSKFRIGKKKFLHSLKPPTANPLKLSLSHKPEQNLLSSRETTQRKTRLLLQAPALKP